MTKEQRHLVQYWIFLVIILLTGVFISYSEIEDKQVAGLLLTSIAAVILWFLNFEQYIGFVDKQETLNTFVEKHPFLKYWFILFCATILPFLIYKMFTTDEIDGELY